MDVFEAIEKRRSVRNYTGKPIPRSDLEKIVKAGSLAPSGTNKQKWDFVVVTDKGAVEDMIENFPAGRKYETYEDGKFDGTSAIIAVVMDPNEKFWKEDGSAATQNMLLAARGLGYGTCWIQGLMQPHEDHFKEIMGIPTEKTILLIITLGEPIKWPSPPPKKELSQILHWEKFRVL